MTDLPPADSELFPRTKRTLTYHLYITAMMVLSITIMIFVPYSYDEYNKRAFEAARDSGNLVVQEFRSAYDAAILEECRKLSCNIDSLQARFKDKKLIALDYVTQMERASKLDIFQILALTGFALLSVALATILVTLHVASLRWRITLLITVVGAVIIGIQFAYSLGGVAHINVKFYYLFGILIAMVVSIGDYLHHVRVVDHPDGDSKFTAIALQERHKKWTSALGYSLTLLTVMLGTISFNVIPYIRLVFGDSFLIAPTLGIAVACAFLILIFSMGIIGNIRKILIEIESEIARLRDTAATQA